MDMFIKIGSLKGEAQDSKHKDEIDVLSWNWGVTNSGSAHVGGGAGAGKCNVQDFSFTKYLDKASPDLMLAACNGKHFDKAVVTVRKAGENPLEYLQITLEEVLVSSVSTGGAGGEDGHPRRHHGDDGDGDRSAGRGDQEFPGTRPPQVVDEQIQEERGVCRIQAEAGEGRRSHRQVLRADGARGRTERPGDA